ncbi:uncharacterized protein LOC132244815 [Alligator mississippiensis]|uniref:uncharacterized protein LOC132244815 n=1 Tax=Alligator mississippiensis TaxID=8496 RepID=UPI0028781077|nr:uncharacterized protein LOC132244815 [Alligator mississippiensis]
MDAYLCSLQARSPTVQPPQETRPTQEWQKVSRSRAARPRVVEAPQVHLANRFEALAAVTEKDRANASGADDVTPHATWNGQRTNTSRKKRQVLIIGDSILRGLEGPICRPDPMTWEVCFMPGAWVRDITESIPAYIRPTDQYPMVVIHVGMNDAARGNLNRIMKDFEALGAKLKEMGVQVVFSSLLPVSRRGRRHDACIGEVSQHLWSWCRQAGLGFLDNDPCFWVGDLLGWDGLHLSRKGKRVFSSRLADLVQQALN